MPTVPPPPPSPAQLSAEGQALLEAVRLEMRELMQNVMEAANAPKRGETRRPSGELAAVAATISRADFEKHLEETEAQKEAYLLEAEQLRASMGKLRDEIRKDVVDRATATSRSLKVSTEALAARDQQLVDHIQGTERRMVHRIDYIAQSLQSLQQQLGTIPAAAQTLSTVATSTSAAQQVNNVKLSAQQHLLISAIVVPVLVQVLIVIVNRFSPPPTPTPKTEIVQVVPATSAAPQLAPVPAQDGGSR